MSLRDESTADLEAELRRRKEDEKARLTKPWPRQFTMWAHTNKVFEADEGPKFEREAWGKDQAPSLFWHIGAELKLTFEVEKDGSGELSSIHNGKQEWRPVGLDKEETR